MTGRGNIFREQQFWRAHKKASPFRVTDLVDRVSVPCAVHVLYGIDKHMCAKYANVHFVQGGGDREEGERGVGVGGEQRVHNPLDLSPCFVTF